MSCKGFDEQVVRHDKRISELMEQFVRVRIIQGNGMDLSLFQFDYDLTFAAFFLNADRTIYGRFGTRSNFENAAKDISLQGFRKALEGALELHRDYPANKELLAGKTGPEPQKKVPEAYPALLRYTAQLNFNDRVNAQCIHCHQVGQAQREVYWYERKRVPDHVLYPFPLPSVLGLTFSPNHPAKIRNIAPGSSAEKDGFRSADELLTLNGQPILSIADIQWILHRAPSTGSLPTKINRRGQEIDLRITLNDGWRQGSDISWRTTTQELRLVALGGMTLQNLSDVERQRRGISETKMGLRVGSINRAGRRGGQTNAAKAGIQRGDVIVAFGDRTQRLTESGIIGYVLQERPEAKVLPIVVLRDGKQMEFQLSLD